MRRGGERTVRRASLPETVGAWLKIWTPPRDVEVPPVPVRRLAIGAAVLLVVAAGATAALVPAIDASKDRRAARDARETAARREAARLRTIHDQRPHRAAAADLRPPAGAAPARRLAARAALIHRAETAITADARRRAATGELTGRPSGTRCQPYPPRPDGQRPEQLLSARTGVYDCLVAVQEIKATQTNAGGELGYPFRAVVDFGAFSFVWCKTNPIPGERVVPDPRTVVQLPKECRA